MKFFTRCKSSECLPQFVQNKWKPHTSQSKETKKQDGDHVDVTNFVRKAVLRGIGLHLLGIDIFQTEKPFPLSEDSEEQVESIVRTVTSENLPFVIILPDMTMIASREVRDGDNVVLLAKEEVYREHYEVFDCWEIITGHPGGYGDGSTLSFAEISDNVFPKLIVVGNDGSMKQNDNKVIENMSRLYFHVYENTDSEEAAVERAKSFTASDYLSSKKFRKGDGRSWTDEDVNSACAKVHEIIVDRHLELINFFIRKHLFQGYTRQPEDAVRTAKSRNPCMQTTKDLLFKLSMLATTRHPSSQPSWKSKSKSVANGIKNRITNLRQSSGASKLGEYALSVIAAMESLVDEIVPEMYQAKLLSKSENQVHIKPEHIQRNLQKIVKDISESISDASRKAVKAFLEANGFKSPTAKTDDRVANGVAPICESTICTHRGCCCCRCCRCCCCRFPQARGNKATRTYGDRNGDETSVNIHGDGTSADINDAQGSTVNSSGNSSAENNNTESAADDNGAESSAANSGAERSATNDDARGAGVARRSADDGDLEARVACWIMRAMTIDVQYRHAAAFLMSTDDRRKIDDEKRLADFICKPPEVKGDPKNLDYEPEQEGESNDPRDACCSWFLYLIQSIQSSVKFLTKSIMGERGKKYWCSRNAVVTWSILGLVLYILFFGLVAVSVLVSVKSEDNGWEATEVAMNLILTGAVGIFLGIFGFETGSRQVVLDALMFQRAVEDLPKDSKYQRPLLQELVAKKYPESCVKSKRSEGCTWLPRQGSGGWTKLPKKVPFKDVVVDGKLFINDGNMSADICG